MDSKKMANNILEFMFDPTVIPVEKRLYFRPEEKLDNKGYTDAKADSYKAYGDERRNSDFYPLRNKSKEASTMDRKTIIASLDVLSQNFSENDPIGKDLRTMAYAVSKMSDGELGTRLASSQVEAKKVKLIKCPKCGNPKVMAQTGYCLKCKTKGIGKDEKADKKDDKKKSKKASGEWSKEAALAVKKALIADVCAADEAAPMPTPEAVPAPAPEAAPAPKKDEAPKAEKKEEKAEEKNEEAPKAEEKEAMVDTSILAMEEDSSIDEVTLTAEDKAQLDKLFK